MEIIAKRLFLHVFHFVLGTGSVIEHIREVAGYDGVVDILDANLPMLAKAESKGLNIR